MTDITAGIRYLTGSTDILVIAPHGPLINGVYQNDLRTGIIAEELHRELGCSAIINDRFFKPKGKITKDAANYFLDVFRIVFLPSRQRLQHLQISLLQAA